MKNGPIPYSRGEKKRCFFHEIPILSFPKNKNRARSEVPAVLPCCFSLATLLLSVVCGLPLISYVRAIAALDARSRIGLEPFTRLRVIWVKPQHIHYTCSCSVPYSIPSGYYTSNHLGSSTCKQAVSCHSCTFGHC